MKLLFVSLFIALPLLSSGEELSGDEVKFFETRIRPALSKYCYECHSEGEKIKGGLRVDYRDGLIHGGDSGAAIVPGDLEKSLLYTSITWADSDYEMPPKRKMPAEVIADFKTWIEMGAPDPRVPEKVVVKSEINIEEGRKFWSYQPPRKTAHPEVEDKKWPRNGIDHFVLAKLESNQLSPAGEAPPETLLRRLHFDLTGLPPTYGEIKKFAAAWKKDPAAAYRDKVDKLLASEHFGERWGRHWLDVARYAESTGKELNATFPFAWRYRDYVIDSFNEDKPYDRFVQEQIAGDLLPVKSDEDWQKNLIATGFLAMGTKSLNQRNPRQFAMDQVDEQIDAMSQAFLGITVACARCHDHKSDPIPTEDYYALAGIFQSTKTLFGTVNVAVTRRATKLIELPVKATEAQGDLSPEQYQNIRDRLEASRQEVQELFRNRSQRSANDQQRFLRLRSTINALEELVASHRPDGSRKSFAMGVQDQPRTTDATVLVRGELDTPAQEVPRGFLQVLNHGESTCPPDSSGRLELAQWITSSGNPLTARVMVNRIWSHLFGQGLVGSPDNFGVSGQRPSHPELLDNLALDFMKKDWSVKSLIRNLVMSSTYRMSSTWNNQSYQQDPANTLLWRMPPRRLDAEAIRDAMLSVSGQLDKKRPAGSAIGRRGDTILGRQNANLDPNAYDDHRSVYLPVVRDGLPEVLALFDGADANIVTGKREQTNVPPQALYLMNNNFVRIQAKSLATRLMDHTKKKPEWIDLSFFLCYGRSPLPEERKAAKEFFTRFWSYQEGDGDDYEALTAFCHALFASAEFRYLN